MCVVLAAVFGYSLLSVLLTYNRNVAQTSRLHYRVPTSFSYCQREEQKATGKNQSETDSSEARHDALGGTQNYKQIEVIILPLAILQCNLVQILVNTGYNSSRFLSFVRNSERSSSFKRMRHTYFALSAAKFRLP